MMSRNIVIIFLFLLMSCNDTQVVVDGDCGPGVKTTVEKGRTFCAYTWEIVIETGFSCPSEFGSVQRFEPVFGVCSGFGALKEIEIIHVFDEFQKLPRFKPVVNTPPKSLDLLFVVDNSGSMCQEQDRLLAAFEGFITPLKDVDFHLGVTTTGMDPHYTFEPLGKPGLLQSSPQPVPGFDSTCLQDKDASGKVDGYDSLKKRIAFAASCMETVDPYYLNLSDSDVECAFGESDCEIVNRCGGDKPKCRVADITPPPESYRNLPKTFRASDYQTDGELNLSALTADFRCALAVGTRGHGVEKGLSAAALAVSKDVTGGALNGANVDVTKPNHGFIRKDSRFGVVFVTDENDCSHDGGIDETTSCGDSVCEYAIESGQGLTPVTSLKDELIKNLEATKGRKILPNDVVVGSIHGRPTALSGPIRDTCQIDEPRGVVPACATTNGIAYSGSRYADFLAEFDDFGYALSNASAICLEDWTEYFISMGAFFRSKSN